MNRESFLEIHNQDYKQWAERFKIEPIESICPNCKRSLISSIPIAKGDLRGLKTPICECGNSTQAYCFVSVKDNLF